jgi:glycogen debranching enzyme
MPTLPVITTGDLATDRALRCALGDVLGNYAPADVGLIEPGTTVLMAGLTYESWTRDAAFNCWGMLNATDPATARATLRAEVLRGPDGYRMRGQYWDAAVWIIAAYDHAMWTGDQTFLRFARQVGADHLARMEREELSPQLGLFRGPSCFNDGVSGYDDRYADCAGKSCILDWVVAHPAERHPVGTGLPMHALSTNCLYQRAYAVLGEMDRWLGQPADPHHAAMAATVADGIRRHLWDAGAGRFRHCVDPWGADERQESLGTALAVLFGLGSDGLIGRMHHEPAGLPSIWPTHARYTGLTGDRPSIGRHSGLVWPHVEGFAAEAAARSGEPAIAWATLRRFAQRALRDGQFTECYHPLDGMPDGGVQEIDPGAPEDWHAWCLGPRVGTFAGTPIHQWQSQPRTTWGSVALWRLVLRVVAGLDPGPDGLRIAPRLPPGASPLRLSGIRWREAVLDIRIEPGHRHRLLIDGRPAEAVPGDAVGDMDVRLVATPD